MFVQFDDGTRVDLATAAVMLGLMPGESVLVWIVDEVSGCGTWWNLSDRSGWMVGGLLDGQDVDPVIRCYADPGEERTSYPDGSFEDAVAALERYLAEPPGSRSVCPSAWTDAGCLPKCACVRDFNPARMLR